VPLPSIRHFVASRTTTTAARASRGDDVPFEQEQEQAYEEENQQLNEEGKWIFPLYMFHFDPNNSMINTLLYCFMHEIDGNPIKDIT